MCRESVVGLSEEGDESGVGCNEFLLVLSSDGTAVSMGTNALETVQRIRSLKIATSNEEGFLMLEQQLTPTQGPRNSLLQI